MKMKKVLALTMTLGLVLMSAGCGNKGEAEKQDSPPATDSTDKEEVKEDNTSGAVEIEYWSLFGGADGETMTKMVSKFNEEYAGKIKVNLVTQDWDNYYTKIKTAILGGQAPDLCNSHDEYVNGLIKENIIVPIDEACEETGVKIEFDNYIDKINQLKSDDKYYAVPMDCLQLMVHYNKTMVAEAGLADENGLLNIGDGVDSFLEVVKTLDEKLDVPGFAVATSGSIPMYLFNSLYYQFGGEGKFVSEDGKEWTADEGTALKALEAYQEINQSGLQNVENISDLLIQKKVAMVMEGAWQMNYLHQNLGEDYGVMSLPKFGDVYKTAIYSHTFVLPNNEQRSPETTKATLEFVKWFCENSDQWAEAGSVPAYVPAQDTELFNSYPMHPYFKEAVEYATPFTGTAPFALKGSAEINEPLGKLARAEVTPEQCFEEISQRLTTSFN